MDNMYIAPQPGKWPEAPLASRIPLGNITNQYQKPVRFEPRPEPESKRRKVEPSFFDDLALYDEQQTPRYLVYDVPPTGLDFPTFSFDTPAPALSQRPLSPITPTDGAFAPEPLLSLTSGFTPAFSPVAPPQPLLARPQPAAAPAPAPAPAPAASDAETTTLFQFPPYIKEWRDVLFNGTDVTVSIEQFNILYEYVQNVWTKRYTSHSKMLNRTKLKFTCVFGHDSHKQTLCGAILIADLDYTNDSAHLYLEENTCHNHSLAENDKHRLPRALRDQYSRALDLGFSPSEIMKIVKLHLPIMSTAGGAFTSITRLHDVKKMRDKNLSRGLPTTTINFVAKPFSNSGNPPSAAALANPAALQK